MIKELHGEMIRPAPLVKLRRKLAGFFIGHQKRRESASSVKGDGGVAQVPRT